MTIRVYYASVCGSVEMRKNQDWIFSILESKKIEFERVDITQGCEHKEKMRELLGDPTALPPQIFNGDTHCGDINAFKDAIEMEELEAFLKL